MAEQTPPAPPAPAASIQIASPPIGFGSVLTIELLTTDHTEHDRILDALRNAGYTVHIAAALSGPNGNGVMGGRWTLARDIRPLRTAPPPQPPPAQPDPSESRPSATKRIAKKASRSGRKKKR